MCAVGKHRRSDHSFSREWPVLAIEYYVACEQNGPRELFEHVSYFIS